MKKLISIFCALAIIVSVIFAVPTIVGAAASDTVVGKQVTYTAPNGTAVLYDYDSEGVFFNTFGKNLFTDPAVSAFDENGDYLWYYNWDTHDSSVVLNKNAWWDNPALDYNGFRNVGGDNYNYYTSLRNSGYTNNDPTKSHTPDGSGVIEVKRTSTNNKDSACFIPLPEMKSHTYYAITFFAKVEGNSTNTTMVIKQKPGGDDFTSYFNLLGVAAVNPGWNRYTFLIYTGNVNANEAAMSIPGDNNTTIYYDDFGMYELDATYGAECMDAGKMLPKALDEEIYPTAQKAVTLNFADGQYRTAYEDVDFSKYGMNICPDPTVARFTNGVYSSYFEGTHQFTGTVIDPLAVWDKPISYQQKAAGFGSQNDKGYVSSDTSLSHTNDGSGAIYYNGGTNPVQRFALPDMQKYSYYLISYWVKIDGTASAYGNETILMRDANDNSFSDGNDSTFDYAVAKEQSDGDWQRVVVLYYTGSKNKTYNEPGLFLRLYLQYANVTVDDIYVYKLDDAATAADWMSEGRLITTGDMDGNLIVDAEDFLSLRDNWLKNTLDVSSSADTNGDGNVDILDFVTIKNKMTLDAYKFYKKTDAAMRNASYLYEGDDRFSYKLKEALYNKNAKTKVAFIGDSITAGASSGSYVDENFYSTVFANWWKDNVKNDTEFVRFGAPSTDSHWGVHWFEETILVEQPDIIFIEFVNEEFDERCKIAIDNIVRRCLELPNNPAVVLIEMTYYQNDVFSYPQEQHMEVAKAYGVPVVSFVDAVKAALESKELYDEWKDFSNDTVHPHKDGYRMLAEMLVNFTSRKAATCAAVEEPAPFDSTMDYVYGDKYMNATVLSYDDGIPFTASSADAFTETVDISDTVPGVEKGWATSNGGSITFENVEFKDLSIAYARNVESIYNGTATVYVDGQLVSGKTLKAKSSWGPYIEVLEIMSNDTVGAHTITIEVTEGTTFNVLGLLVSK